jgi:ribosomal protein L40E
MRAQTNYEIVQNLLAAKKSLEKTGEYSHNTLRKIKEIPVSKVRPLKLSLAMQHLKAAEGDSKKIMATALMKTAMIPHKPVAKSAFCVKCGASVAANAAFCSKCGTKRMKI